MTEETILSPSDLRAEEGASLQDAKARVPQSIFFDFAGYEFTVTIETRLVRGKSNPFLLQRLAVSSAFMRGPKNQFAPKRLNFYIARTALRQGLTRASAGRMPSRGQRLRIAFVYVVDSCL